MSNQGMADAMKICQVGKVLSFDQLHSSYKTMVEQFWQSLHLAVGIHHHHSHMGPRKSKVINFLRSLFWWKTECLSSKIRKKQMYALATTSQHVLHILGRTIRHDKEKTSRLERSKAISFGRLQDLIYTENPNLQNGMRSARLQYIRLIYMSTTCISIY